MRGFAWAVFAVVGALATPAGACMTADSQQALIHSALPARLPPTLVVLHVELPPASPEPLLYAAGLRARVQRVIQGDDPGPFIIVRSMIEDSCDVPFLNGRNGFVVGVVRGQEAGELVVEPILVSRAEGYRLAEGYTLSPYYTEPGYLRRLLKERSDAIERSQAASSSGAAP